MNKSMEQLHEDLMEQEVTCKYCGNTAKYGDLTWLNGKCMCPECYRVERDLEDKRSKESDK